MLNLTRTIKSLPLIAVLFTCVVILSSAAIFASEESFPSSEVSSFLTQPAYEQLAKGTTTSAEVRATTATLNDIYNCLQGAGSTVWGKLADIVNILRGTSGLNSPFFYSGYSLAQLQGMTWALVDDIHDDTTTLTQINGTIYNNISTTNAKLEYIFSAIEDTINIKWYNSNVNYLGTSLDFNTNYLSSRTTSKSFAVGFSGWGTGLSPNTPCIARVYIPIATANDYYFNNHLNVSALSRFYNSSFSSIRDIPEHFVVPTHNGTYIYFLDFRPTWESVFIKVSSDLDLVFYPNFSASIFYIPFDTIDYQQIKTAFYQMKSANLQGQDSGNIQALADYIVSPEKQAAEDASQAVINDTLSGFTGSGSAAPTTSDTGSMKNMSGSIKSGLDSGGSAGDAASVFTNANFWSWFTQSTSDGINNAYPAPVVEQRRGSGDEIPDFISGDHEELENYRNRRDRW